MSGEYNGVQARVKIIEKRAVYIHCYAHCLNLVLVDTIKQNKIARDFFGVLESLYCFIRNITCRHALFLSLQNDFEDEGQSHEQSLEMKKLYETRWVCRYEAIRALEANFSVLLDVLKTIEDTCKDSKTVSDARGLQFQMLSFEFILAMIVLKVLFGRTNVISRYLQSKQLDLGAAVSSIQATLEILEKLHSSDTHFHDHFIAAECVMI